MKFGQLIEYNMSNIFIEKSYPTCDGEIGFQTVFSKIVFVFILSQVKGYQNKLNVSCRPPAFTSF